MQVTFYSGFKKRINSTKRPSGGTAMDILMKEPCDLHSPIVKLAASAGQYNYFSIGNTYYYVVGETVFPNGWVELRGEVDAMATCADDIKGTKAFILRYSGGSTDLMDTYAPPMSSGTMAYESEQLVFPINNTGTFVVSLADMPYPVAMTMGEMFELYNMLNSEAAVKQVQNTYADLSGYVRGCIWIPFTISTIGTLSIKAGTFDTGVSASYISTEVMTKNLTFSLPLDDTILSSSSYCSLKLQLPFAGTASLSVDDFRDSKTLHIIATMDTSTGAISYYVSSGASIAPVASFSGTAGVPIAIGSTSYSISGGVSGFVTGLAYALSNGSGAAFFQASHSSSQVGGGGFRTKILTASVGLMKHSPPEALVAKAGTIGLPTMRTMTIGSVSGFVQCDKCTIESAEEPDIVNTCNNYLNSGAWIE